MGQIEAFSPWKLVVAQLIAEDLAPDSADEDLVSLFGPIDYISPVMAFFQTQYYTEEMGPRLSRRFISFREPVSPQRLGEIKIRTNQLEEKFAPSRRRKINLDPGILNLSRFILATTKDNSHRIPLRDGIFAELTLQYTKKDFRPLAWTYPDYASQEYRDILSQIREKFKEDMKQHGF